MFTSSLRLGCVSVCALAVSGWLIAAPAPADSPAAHFDLTHWKLTLPTGTKGKPDEVAAATLTAGYTQPPYFVLTPDGAMRFWCPVTGVSTRGSEFPRCELREQLTAGRDRPNWFGAGQHLLTATVVVRQPPSSGRVIIGQIHGQTAPDGTSANPLVKLEYDAEMNGVQVEVKDSPFSKNSGQHNTMVGAHTLPVGTKINYAIKVVDGVVTITINSFAPVTRDVFATDPAWRETELYYKAGNYCQDHTGPATEGAIVDFYSLAAAHGPAVAALANSTAADTTAVTPVSATATKAKPVVVEETPTGFPGADTFVYRQLSPEPVRLHVFKPKGWAPSDRRPAFVFFYGGGWTHGTPEHAVSWAKWANGLGMVGIAPDYRTKQRFGTSPLEAVADGRAALHWIEAHADELGIDPARIVVGGNSAGGHLALWTAIQHAPPGSDAHESPALKPAALVLLSPVSDTSAAKGYTPGRFGENADALSAQDQLDPRMPPVLLFHGDADTTVPQRQSLDLRDKLIASGNACEFINVPGGSHSFSTGLPEWKDKTRTLVERFLVAHQLTVTSK